MITKIRKGLTGINLSVAVNDANGARKDPETAEIKFYKVQADGSLALDTSVGNNGVLSLVQQDGETGFFGIGVDTSALSEGEYVILVRVVLDGVETIGTEYLSIDKALNIKLDADYYASVSNADKDDIVNKVWDEPITDHTTADTFGAKNQKVVPSEVVDDYKADVSGIVAQTDKLQFDANNYVLSHTKESDISTVISESDKDDIAARSKDAVWNAAKADYTTAGTFGDYLDDKVSIKFNSADYVEPDNAGISGIKAQTDKLQFDANNYVLASQQGNVSISQADKDEIKGGVWDELITNHNVPGSFGETNQVKVPSPNVDDYKADLTVIDGKIDNVKSDTTAIKAQTDKIQFDTNEYVKSVQQGDVTITQADKDEIKGGVWDEDRVNHVNVGSFGEKLQKGVPSENLDDYKATGFSTPADISSAKDEIINNSDVNKDAIINNDNTNKDTIISNDNTNKDTIMTRIEQHDIDVKGTPWDSDKSLSGIYGILEEEEHGTVKAITSETLDINGVPLGLILDENGDPVDDAKLTAYRESDVDFSTPVFETHSFANGDFRLLVSVGETYNIVITKGGYSYGIKTVVVAE